ncbi:SLC13 family permease [Oceanobacillus luteolus]|uniref:SLC13 family permease n=1 Tax=Oceanobacillus luteolus TaxID=1274358 RepID=A0ABW4HXU6_9BACI|nr:SLC13 family permease [Oceanobacillus luteolus]MCM3740874.1 SLC13 family permease [Oceanobacillus luteolus]
MTWEMIFVAVMIIVMFCALLFEVLRPDIIMFSVVIVFLLTGLLTTEEALKGFSNEGMLTVALLFIVAGAVQKHGVIDRFVYKWLASGKNIKGSLLKFYISIATSSAFLNNTPIVVTFTPLLKKWAEDNNLAPSKFLIPLSYITILSGTITLLGSSTNMVVHGLLLDLGLEGFSLFQLAVVGLPITIVGFIFLFTIGIKLLPNHKSSDNQVQVESREYLAEMTVESNFKYIDCSVREAGLRELKGLYLIQINRGDETISPVKSTTIIREGDRLIFTGLISTIADLEKVSGLKLETGSEFQLDDLRKSDIHLFEVVISHESSLLTKSIKQSKFRTKFDAGILAVHRDNERIKSKIGDIILKAGDRLLLLSGSEFTEKYERCNEFYVISSLDTPSRLEENRNKGWFAVSVLILMIVLVTTGFLTMFKAMALATLLLMLFRVINIEEAKKYIQFNILLLIASAFGIGTVMTKTGLVGVIADIILSLGEPLGLIAILFSIYILTNILTEVITNSAVAVLMLPLGIEIANSLGVSYVGFAVIILIAASASFVTPIGYQTNLIVYGPGAYKFKDFIKIGIPLSLLIMLITVTIVSLIWF